MAYGYGEDYMFKFFNWLDALSGEEITEYQMLFPEPATWKGWWDDTDTCEVLSHGEFCIPLWQPAGKPKYNKAQIQQEIAGGKHYNICLFWKAQSKDGSITESCFSQWWIEEFRAIVNTYCYMEQFMMEQKAVLFGDKKPTSRFWIAKSQTRYKSMEGKPEGLTRHCGISLNIQLFSCKKRPSADGQCVVIVSSDFAAVTSRYGLMQAQSTQGIAALAAQGSVATLPERSERRLPLTAKSGGQGSSSAGRTIRV